MCKFPRLAEPIKKTSTVASAHLAQKTFASAHLAQKTVCIGSPGTENRLYWFTWHRKPFVLVHPAKKTLCIGPIDMTNYPTFSSQPQDHFVKKSENRYHPRDSHASGFDIREHTDDLEPRGREKNAYHCPACGDGKLTIDPKTGKYNCWHCHDTQAIARILSQSHRQKSQHPHSYHPRQQQLEPKPPPQPDCWEVARIAPRKPSQPDTTGVTLYRYTEELWVERSFDHIQNKKRIFPWHLNEGKPKCGKGLTSWPAFGENEAIAAGKGKLVLGVEGEKDAETLHGNGYAAITWQGGSWGKDDLEGTLQKLQRAGVAGIAYLSDNDAAGKCKAEGIAEAAATAGLMCVIVLPTDYWPDAPNKADITDFLEAGGKIERAIAAIHLASKRAIENPEAANWKTGPVEHAIDRIVSEDLHGSNLEVAIATAATETGAHPKMLERTIATRRKEWEAKESSEDTRETIEKILSASASHIDLAEVLPPKLAHPIERITETLSLRPELYLAALLATASALCKAGTELTLYEATDFRVTPGLYLGIVAESSQKKTPIGKAIISSPLKKLNKEAKQRYEAKLAEYEHAIAIWDAFQSKPEERVTRFPDGKPRKPVREWYRITDTTREWLEKQFSQCDQGILYHADELAGLFKSLNAYRNGKGGDEEALLSYWSGEGSVSMRVGDDPRDADEINLSIYGSIQPPVFEKFLGDGSDGNGKFARFDWVYQPLKPSILKEDSGRINLTEMLADIYRTIANLPALDLQLTPEAKKLFVTAHNRAEQNRVSDPHQGMRAYWGKLPAKVGKYAIALHLIEKAFTDGDVSESVSADTMRAAIKLSYFFLQQTRSLYSQYGSSENELGSHLAKVLAKCKSISSGEAIAARKIQPYFQKQKFEGKPIDATRIRAWFVELVELGYGTTEGKGNRLKFKVLEKPLEALERVNSVSSTLDPPNSRGLEESVRSANASSFSVSPPFSPSPVDPPKVDPLSEMLENFSNSSNISSTSNTLAEKPTQQGFEGASTISSVPCGSSSTFAKAPAQQGFKDTEATSNTSGKPSSTFAATPAQQGFEDIRTASSTSNGTSGGLSSTSAELPSQQGLEDIQAASSTSDGTSGKFSSTFAEPPLQQGSEDARAASSTSDGTSSGLSSTSVEPPSQQSSEDARAASGTSGELSSTFATTPTQQECKGARDVPGTSSTPIKPQDILYAASEIEKFASDPQQAARQWFDICDALQNFPAALEDIWRSLRIPTQQAIADVVQGLSG